MPSEQRSPSSGILDCCMASCLSRREVALAPSIIKSPSLNRPPGIEESQGPHPTISITQSEPNDKPFPLTPIIPPIDVVDVCPLPQPRVLAC